MSSSTNGIKPSSLNRGALLLHIDAHNMTRAARFCKFEIRSRLVLDVFDQILTPYDIIDLTVAL